MLRVEANNRLQLSRRCFIASAFSTAGIGASFNYNAAKAAYIPSVSVSDHGALPDGSDAGPGLKKAVASLPRRGGARLYFPPGTYQFRQTSGVAIQIDGIDDLEVEGSGANLLFDGITQPFHIMRCRNATFRNFAIDWPRPPFSQGEVIGIDGGGRWTDIRIDPEFPVDGSETVKTLATYDRSLGLMARGGIDAYNVSQGVTLVGPQLLRLRLSRPLPLKVGDTVVLRHQVFASAAISLNACAAPTVENVRIYAMPGMGVIGSLSRDISVRGLQIMPTPGTARLMSTCADGIHFASCTGAVDIRDCSLAGMGDDGVNVHGSYLRLSRKIDSRTAAFVRRGGAPFYTSELPPDGEQFSFASANTLKQLGEETVAAASPGPAEILHFQSDIPSSVRPGDLVIDSTLRPKLTVSGCHFPGNRARGILAHSDVVIENCVFQNQFEEAILIGPDEYWMEGPQADRVIIRNNLIEGVQRGGRLSAAIKIGAMIQSNGEPVHESLAFVSHELSVDSNEIIYPGYTAVGVSSSDHLSFSFNNIKWPTGPAALLEDVAETNIVGNLCNPPSVITNINCIKIQTHGNHGLDLVDVDR